MMRTPLKDIPEAVDRLAIACTVALFPWEAGMYAVSEDGLSAFVDGRGDVPLQEVLDEHIEDFKLRKQMFEAAKVKSGNPGLCLVDVYEGYMKWLDSQEVK